MGPWRLGCHWRLEGRLGSCMAQGTLCCLWGLRQGLPDKMRQDLLRRVSALRAGTNAAGDGERRVWQNVEDAAEVSHMQLML